jgi:hypothetical protein
MRVANLAEGEDSVMEQCAILFLGPATSSEEARASALRALGFRVDQSDDLPASEGFTDYHAVIVRSRHGRDLPMLGARLRAKRHFGRRVLLALVPDEMADRSKRDAVLSGFDFILPASCVARDLAAAILRLLRPYPEYRCLLRLPGRRRRAA